MANSRPFMDFLREHRGGRTHDELSDQLQELVAAITAENKAGSLTLKISIKPSKGGALEVTDDIKLVTPSETRDGSIFFATAENNLQRNDPRQTSMDLRDVSAPRTPREIPNPGA